MPGDGLVVVGARDGLNDLVFGEVLGSVDHGHKADEHAVTHDLSFESGGAVGVPDRLTPIREHHPHPELGHSGPFQVSGDAAFAERVNDQSGTVLVHRPKVAAPGNLAGRELPQQPVAGQLQARADRLSI